MKLLCLCLGLSVVGAFAQSGTPGTPQRRIVTQSTQSAGTVGTPTSVNGQSTAAGSTTQTSTGTGLTAVPTGAAVSGAGTNASGADTPILQNNVDIFGRIVGTTTNAAVGNTGAGSGTIGNTVGSPVGTAGLTTAQTAGTIGAPGFTQITITLQGTVQSEQDRQSILNRFQGLSGFIVVDQMRLATEASGATINDAAGSSIQSTIGGTSGAIGTGTTGTGATGSTNTTGTTATP